MRAVLLCALALSSCTWVFPEPAPRWPRPADFGTPVWDGAMLRAPTYDAVVSGEQVFVSIFEPAGRNSRLEQVVEPTAQLVSVAVSGAGTTSTLPPSPLPIAPSTLWPASGGVIAAQGTRAVRFSAQSWSELPTLPTAVPDFMLGLDDAVLLRARSALFVLRGGAWTPVTLSPQVTSAVFGPVSGGEVRVIFTHATDGLCTTRLSWSALTTTAPDCLPAQSELLGGESANGAFDDFQAWATDATELQLWRYAGGQWQRGGRARGTRLRSTPDAPFAIASLDVPGTIPLQNLVRVEGGRPTEALFVQSWELLGCDGELRTCARNLGFLRELVAADGSAALFVIENLVDAKRSLYLKRVPLPHRDRGECTPACQAGQLCTRASGIANLCVTDPALAP